RCRNRPPGNGAFNRACRPIRPGHHCCNSRQPSVLVCRQDRSHGGRSYYGRLFAAQRGNKLMKRWTIPILALLSLGFTTTKAYEWRWRRESTAPPAHTAAVSFTNPIAAVGLRWTVSGDIAVL